MGLSESNFQLILAKLIKLVLIHVVANKCDVVKT
jgi:hypothetical protein